MTPAACSAANHGQHVRGEAVGLGGLLGRGAEPGAAPALGGNATVGDGGLHRGASWRDVQMACHRLQFVVAKYLM